MAPLFPAAVAAEDFQIGQLVRWFVSDRQISPYVGKVVEINPAIQKVEVVFPIGGKQQRAPEELIPITMFSDFGSNVSSESMKSNFYTDYQGEQFTDYSSKGVSGLYRKVAHQFFETKIQPLLGDVAAYYNYRLPQKQAQENLFQKYAHLVGEGSINTALNLIYCQKIANSPVDYASIKLILKDALIEEDPLKRQNKIKDAFAIVFNGTGANVFVKVEDLLNEAFQCQEEEDIVSIMRRAVGRAGGDIKRLTGKEEIESKERFSK